MVWASKSAAFTNIFFGNGFSPPHTFLLPKTFVVKLIVGEAKWMKFFKHQKTTFLVQGERRKAVAGTYRELAQLRQFGDLSQLPRVYGLDVVALMLLKDRTEKAGRKQNYGNAVLKY